MSEHAAALKVKIRASLSEKEFARKHVGESSCSLMSDESVVPILGPEDIPNTVSEAEATDFKVDELSDKKVAEEKRQAQLNALESKLKDVDAVKKQLEDEIAALKILPSPVPPASVAIAVPLAAPPKQESLPAVGKVDEPKKIERLGKKNGMWKGHSAFINDYDADDLVKQVKAAVEKELCNEILYKMTFIPKKLRYRFCPIRMIEKKRNQAIDLKLLPPDWNIYIPRIVEDGILKLDLANITLKFRPEFFGYPGATVCFPMSKKQWFRLLAEWVRKSAFDVLDLVSDANLSVVLMVTSAHPMYIKVPFHLRFAFVLILGVSFLLEVVTAASGAWTALKNDFKKTLVQEGKKAFIEDWAFATILRYFSIGTIIKDASANFSSDGIKRCINIGDRFNAVFVNMSPACREYEKNTGLVNKLPKMILEDMVLLGLNVYMQAVYLEGELNWELTFAVFMSCITWVAAMKQVLLYCGVVFAYHQDLSAMVVAGDPLDAAGRLTNLVGRFQVRLIVRLGNYVQIGGARAKDLYHCLQCNCCK